MGMKHFKIALADLSTGKAITESGGKVYVAQAGDMAKQTLYTEAGATLTNPITPTNGMIEFWTVDTNTTVDLYGQGPNGHGFVVKSVAASGPSEIFIDQGQMTTVLKIPFAAADQTAASETDTGFDIPTGAGVLPTVAVVVKTIDATETIDVGTLSTDSGDANGFIAGAAVGVLGTIKGTVTNGSATLGALLYVQDSANAGDEALEMDTTMSGKSITYTLTAGSDTAEGLIVLPMLLAA